MKQLFELALQLEPPWRVVSSDFDFKHRRVDLRLGLRAGATIPLPAMRARLPVSSRRVHRRHVAPAGRDGVPGVRYGPAAVNPLS